MNVSKLEKMIAETATLRPQRRGICAVQQIFADEGFVDRLSGRLCLGFDSSCAISFVHLGDELHRKLRQAVKDSDRDRR
jgi:hypothetical protein